MYQSKKGNLKKNVIMCVRKGRIDIHRDTIFWLCAVPCIRSRPVNSPVSSSLSLLNKRTEDAFFTALTSVWSSIFTNSNEKNTRLLLCLLCIFKFQTLTCRNFWIFYFTSRLTLYECLVNVFNSKLDYLGLAFYHPRFQPVLQQIRLQGVFCEW